MMVPRKNSLLYRKNSAFFKRKLPGLSELISMPLPANLEIDFSEGSLDMVINGERFYGIDSREYSRRQVNLFLEKPSFIELSAPGADDERTPTHAKIYNKINQIIKKSNVKIHQDMQRIDASTTFIFGLGLGHHIYSLIADTRCREIVICEPESSFVAASMYVIDWVELFKLMKNRITFVLEKEPQVAFDYMRWHIHVRNPGVQQTIFYVKHYKSDSVDAIYKEFQEKSFLFFDGLGFYDDERLMTRNHIQNAYRDVWNLCSPTSIPLNATAVVVGSGPSLNNDLDWLREKQSDTFIFSGGSSLQVLLKNDIVPDFHCEIENIPLNYELLKPLIDDYALEDTVLVCSSTMDPKSARLFAHRLWFMREGVMMSALHGDGIRTINWQNPTVINTALSVALALGFKKILLLGADFGTRNVDVHHSRDTAYETNEELKKVEYKFPEKTKGNFGGEVHTSLHFIGAMKTLNVLVSEFRGSAVYNGSDGALISSATPMRSKRFHVEKISEKKKVYVEKMIENSKIVDWDERVGPDLFEDIKRDFSDYMKLLKNKFRRNIKKSKDIIVVLSDFYNELYSISDKVAKFNPLITGSIVNLTILQIYIWRRVANDDVLCFEKTLTKQWGVFFKEIEKDFCQLVDSIRQELPLVRPELFDDKGNLIRPAVSSVPNAE